MEKDMLIKGIGVNPGQASGKVKIILNVKDISHFEPEREIPNWDDHSRLGTRDEDSFCGGNEPKGGIPCHPVIVSRELGVPRIVGTEKATSVLKDNEIETVDGQKGN